MSKAVIIGGSVAGLLTAAAIRQAFDQVWVIERDKLEANFESRKGAPQGQHVHNLLVTGLNTMEALLPGFTADLDARGARYLQYGMDVRSLTKGGWLQGFESHYVSRAASRGLVEGVIRAKVKALPNITIMDETTVLHLLFEADQRRVTGLEVQPKGSDQPQRILADVVIDASGRTSRMTEWLTEYGYSAPVEEVVDAKVGYATVIYPKPEGFTDWAVLYMPPVAPHTRGGAILEIEGGLWMASLGGYLEDYPPTEHDEFVAYAATLAEPDLYNAIKDLEPLSKIISYRRTANRRLHFEQLNDLPDRLFAVGDAVCGFNPVYGQGMTAAALGAHKLGEMIKQANGRLDGLNLHFQRDLAKLNEPIWLLATGIDYGFLADAHTKTSFMDRLMQRYMDYLLPLLPHDPVLANDFLAVMNLDKTTTVLVRPNTVMKVLGRVMTGA
ncbi:MAG: NAD(P)/FAD-dependent oxidoreductase [Phototrophicaceae bacterium]